MSLWETGTLCSRLHNEELPKSDGIGELTSAKWEINGQPASKIHIDTGSSMSMVQRKVVPVSTDTGHFVTMRNTTGTQRHPVAKVRVELDGLSYQKKMAVSEELEDHALLGLDFDIWPHLVKAMKKDELNRMKRLIEEEEKERTYAVSVVPDEQHLEQKNHENGKDGEEEGEKAQNLSLWEQFPFDDAVFAIHEKCKQYKSRAQRREHKKTLGKDPLVQESLSR